MTADQRMLGEPRRYVERIEALEAEISELRAGEQRVGDDAYDRGYIAGWSDAKNGPPVNALEERARVAVGVCQTCGRVLPRLGLYYLPCVACSMARAACDDGEEA